ncbi:MAG TPA: hypothetical protein VMJ93_02135 [Verrucomicrobiae bacterium]|nr:hypothetical protein [Verrucomicrobiae bacterium]
MRYLKILALAGIFLASAPFAHAQRVAIGVGIGVGPAYAAPAYVGPAPVCAYGYYAYPPYACAPYGYYGPSWFSSGVFIGAGPWFHGYAGHPVYWGRPGVYGRPGFVARDNFVHGGPVARGPVPAFHGGAPAGGFHGGGRR